MLHGLVVVSTIAGSRSIDNNTAMRAPGVVKIESSEKPSAHQGAQK
jgi:hypothetical protein